MNRLVETTRLLRNVFQKRNPANSGQQGQTELELSRKYAALSNCKITIHIFSGTIDGYAFSQEEHGAMRQGDMVRAYDTTRPSR